ncbi:MAG: RNA-binding S4 domain-containing protein, partial [Immundisolibacter sp.]|uniref:RNA-binding S4 domain-containing protein n=1 Tax=Immundisolibacter sp. TaxID=1934948 RepID=UPI003EE30A3F
TPDERTEVRVDKWLWCVRVYKNRAVATEACRGGRVSIGGHPVRAARTVRPGDVVEINLGGWKRTLRVIADLHHRVKASALPAFVEDITPKEELDRAKERRSQNLLGRPAGEGRPTKSDRREWKRAFHGKGF